MSYQGHTSPAPLSPKSLPQPADAKAADTNEEAEAGEAQTSSSSSTSPASLSPLQLTVSSTLRLDDLIVEIQDKLHRSYSDSLRVFARLAVLEEPGCRGFDEPKRLRLLQASKLELDRRQKEGDELKELLYTLECQREESWELWEREYGEAWDRGWRRGG